MTTLLIIGVIIVAGVAYLNRPLSISPAVQMVLDNMKDFDQWRKWGELHYVHKDTGIEVKSSEYHGLVLMAPEAKVYPNDAGEKDKSLRTLISCLSKERVPINRTERKKLKQALRTIERKHIELDAKRRKGLLTSALGKGDDIVERFLDE